MPGLGPPWRDRHWRRTGKGAKVCEGADRRSSADGLAIEYDVGGLEPIALLEAVVNGIDVGEGVQDGELPRALAVSRVVIPDDADLKLVGELPVADR